MSEPTTNILISQNRKARFNYFITDTIEAGLALVGSEVKSARLRQVNLSEGFISASDGELYLLQTNIATYPYSNQFNHEPTRPRKLLLKKREITKLLMGIQKKGTTLVPLSMYFNKKGRAKLSIGLAEGKKQVDKRATIKERDWNRQKQRVLKGEE
jgi:SsrA-binding protein